MTFITGYHVLTFYFAIEGFRMKAGSSGKAPHAHPSANQTRPYFLKRVRVLAMLLTTLIFYQFVIRPWMFEWGAPEKIQQLSLPGDDLTAGGHHTRAVFINDATPEEIWPWILQLGQERGGFYSYTFLENLFRADMKNIYEQRTDLQEPRLAGDTIWLASRSRYPDIGFQILAIVEPQKSLVMVSGTDYNLITTGKKAEGSWSIYLYPQGKQGTWLISRSSAASGSVWSQFLRYIFFDIPHFIMEQKMLRTIRELAVKNGLN